MTKLSWSLAAIVLTLIAGSVETSWGRGFGGMHGGGMPGGGMHVGGGMPGGGMRPVGGGMRPGGNFGGMSPGSNFGGPRPGGNFGGGNFGGAGPGGNFGGGNFGGARPGGNFGGANFGGARPGGSSPSGAFGNVVNNLPNFGGAGQPGNAGFGNRGFPGAATGGFGGNQTRPVTPGGSRGPGVEKRIAAPDRGQLGSFLGMPSDGGMHGVAGNKLGADNRGFSRYSNSDLQRRGDYVRRDFHYHNYYSADWYRRYPGAWYPNRWAYGNAWAVMTWDSMNGWFGYGDTQPVYYDYGNNVTYQDNSVYMNGQEVGTSDEYYQQAQTLATTDAPSQPADDAQWMPLGVFAMTHDDQSKANLILQLAVNKEGIIRGNYTATQSQYKAPWIRRRSGRPGRSETTQRTLSKPAFTI